MLRAFAIAGLGAAFSAMACGQAATSAPAFEVASVKVNNSGGRSREDAKGDRLAMTNAALIGMIAFAYDMPFDRITGPGWLYDECYDIAAKFDPDTTTRDTLRLMMQNLLAERFKLALHHEQKPTPVWALVLGRKGLKLHESAADRQQMPRCSRNGTQLTCAGQKVTLAELAEAIPHWLSQGWLGAPVVDQTGVAGVYDFSLTWTMTNRREDPVEPPGLSLFDAIEDQLGLKLEERKVALDRIVVDHAERVPTPD